MISKATLYYKKYKKNTLYYKLNIYENQTEIIANNYYGFLRAIETFSQLIDTNYQINQIPIQIEDEPYMQYRGIMLDCARHFMPVSTILRTIDAMQYNKMNALHLHLADDESFPLYISEEPQVTELGAYNKQSIYSLEDIKTILQHGNQAGVRIIPEIDSPSHARSWALMEKYANCNIICPGAEHYNGQLDITLDLTYELVEKIVNSTQNLFTDDYIHLGGDEVINSCYDKRPSIKTWMKNKGMDTSNYIGLQKYYRAQQKKMLKNGKSSIYWCNEQLNIPPTEDQILQYWGQYENLDMLLDVPNKIIISSEDKLYINMGQGFVFGNSFGSYLTWKTVYDFEPLPKGYTKDRILGAEACLWSEVNNEFTVDNNLWIRGSALAERLWSQQKDTTESLVIRLDQMQKDLVKRGIEAAPATSQFCSKYPQKCF
ncbi:Glycoside hydrolase, superfamily [Pseudocohnilembus persalinus]|uniref:beta-N-acetylhexosaminidase n=1 Tax=Pseudocohnilembus persalinus TaxID=266149 RepID=A0A0V0QLG2_PSEPJ|nr:Glycoside hydrolase, superfamily [Pseudocohnilembus persalinus]|eukprot:KRX03069.1 Glycoside hydrolase, superfamily [Pseudocohnilembus persalinus]